MAAKKVKSPKMVLVYWDDAVHECSGDEGELVPSPLVTIGFLDKKTKKYIRMYHEYECGDGKDYKRHTSAIPMRMVTKIVEVSCPIMG